MGQIESLIKAFEDGVDIHSRTASEIFELPLDKVTQTHRRMAKTINFGIIYGISPYGLSSRLGIEIGLAKKYIDLYFIKYPGIKNYMDKEIEFARKHGYVCTLAGRKCFMPGINDRNFSIRGFNERASINAPLQGTQADIMKLAMKKLYQLIIKDKLPVKMLLQIHDELLFEVAETYVAEFTPIVKDVMEKAVKLDLPSPVDVSVGDNWGEL
jgi:DNA polymerase-1